MASATTFQISNVDCVRAVTLQNTKKTMPRPRTTPTKRTGNKTEQKTMPRPRTTPTKSTGKKTEPKTKKDQNLEENEDDRIFEEKFLDPHYSIRDDVHEKLKSFQWLCGEYGIAGSNEEIPRTHLYVTLKKGTEESKVFDDLEAAFMCKATDYFELRPDPETSITIKFLSKPTSGGRVLAVNEENESGILTMFCVKNGCHHALTCFHVACITGEDKNSEEGKLSIDELKKIRNSVKAREEYAREQLKYCFTANENKNTDSPSDLGKFCKGSFDSESDIMSIEVSQGVEIDCTVAEIESPSWPKIWKELYRRVEVKRESVSVRKVGCSSDDEVQGYIEKINWSYKPDNDDDNLYQNAIKVIGIQGQGQGQFLKPGDSGALLSFLDFKNKEQAFCYCVGEVDLDGPFFLCFKLDVALKKLNFDISKGCFKTCSESTNK